MNDYVVEDLVEEAGALAGARDQLEHPLGTPPRMSPATNAAPRAV